MSVGEKGRINFSEFASFEENWSERGGALCNLGMARFFRRSLFFGNEASKGEENLELLFFWFSGTRRCKYV